MCMYLYTCVCIYTYTHTHTHMHTHIHTHTRTHTNTHIFLRPASERAAHCNTLQHTATTCNTPQQPVTHCNTLGGRFLDYSSLVCSASHESTSNALQKHTCFHIRKFKYFFVPYHHNSTFGSASHKSKI